MRKKAQLVILLLISFLPMKDIYAYSKVTITNPGSRGAIVNINVRANSSYLTQAVIQVSTFTDSYSQTHNRWWSNNFNLNIGVNQNDFSVSCSSWSLSFWGGWSYGFDAIFGLKDKYQEVLTTKGSALKVTLKPGETLKLTKPIHSWRKSGSVDKAYLDGHLIYDFGHGQWSTATREVAEFEPFIHGSTKIIQLQYFDGTFSPKYEVTVTN